MKKLFLILLAALTIISCNKKPDPVSSLSTQDVSFGIEEINSNAGLKASPADGWNCATINPDHAWITITAPDGTKSDYYPQLFTLDGKLYTQSIKLPVLADDGKYTVNSFLLYKESDGQAGYSTSDTIVYGTPMANSEFAVYVDKPVTFQFGVTAFSKAEISVQVLCFNPAVYQSFGFEWYSVQRIAVRLFKFFGDLCLNADPYSPSDYVYSLYDQPQLPLGVQVDVPILVKMRVYKNGVEVPYSPFTNATLATNYGVGAPLIVYYPDNLDIPNEVFTFELYILVKNAGGSFSYQLYNTFNCIDDGPLMDGETPVPNMFDDVLLYYALGTCDNSPTDLIFNWKPQLTDVTVQAADLVNGPLVVNGLPNDQVFYKNANWFFYNDETDEIDNTLGSFVVGPDTPPLGAGSAQITVSGTERRNLATFQFAGTPLTTITTLKFSTYNPTSGNGGSASSSGFLFFNVDFNGSDTWQNRLIFVPSAAEVAQNTWQEWDALQNGDALWSWSGLTANGGSNTQWPDGSTDTYRTWSDILTAFPNARIALANGLLGIRVGSPNPDGFTENIDAFKFGIGLSFITFDFEPTP
ncbi:MAG: hypothetical protein IH595_13605 [Bacteroidales bacterium]|nr:hypothetical protein [Bacteroidales bacterium]